VFVLRNFVLGVASVLTVLAMSYYATAEAESNRVKASLFDARVMMNNLPAQLNSENPLLNCRKSKTLSH